MGCVIASLASRETCQCVHDCLRCTGSLKHSPHVNQRRMCQICVHSPSSPIDDRPRHLHLPLPRLQVDPPAFPIVSTDIEPTIHAQWPSRWLRSYLKEHGYHQNQQRQETDMMPGTICDETAFTDFHDCLHWIKGNVINQLAQVFQTPCAFDVNSLKKKNNWPRWTCHAREITTAPCRHSLPKTFRARPTFL